MTDSRVSDETPTGASICHQRRLPLTPKDTAIAPLFIDVLRARRRITFVLADSDELGGHYGLTDLQEGVIWLDASNTFGEMRATLAHELAHLAYPDSDEEAVEHVAARLLVNVHDAFAAEALGNIEETAERLAVDPRLIRARLRAADADTVAAGEAG